MMNMEELRQQIIDLQTRVEEKEHDLMVIQQELNLMKARLEDAISQKHVQSLKEEQETQLKARAKEEAEKVLSSARKEIQNEKNKAIEELKNQVADFSFEIAEKVIGQKLNDADKQSDSVKSALNEINFN